MGGDDAACGGRRIEFRQPLGQVFIRKSVEAVAPQAASLPGARQAQAVDDRIVPTVEGGVEDERLREGRARQLNGAHGCQGLRLVQWSQGGEVV
jgi:hypothetical protein